MDISDYVVNGEWDLIATPAVRNVKRFECCPEPYPTVTFFMHIRRRTLYYGLRILRILTKDFELPSAFKGLVHN